MAEQKNNRRLKILSIHFNVVLSVVSGQRPTNKNYHDIFWFDLPKDIEIVDVHYNYMTQTFDFVLRHDSFDEVEECDSIPKIECKCVKHRLELTKQQQSEINKWLNRH